ncbi:acyl-CoA dehydrogenase family protein [Pseudonocardia sp. McavD-2-B]|uniref:acyl-CoA dehydrogenase family protein n=1 Tax=Pseudonocardia sp. McavD-2-B TaxID=2954499 RepID=UPI0020971164|nr:acyl-CoA dehydrogenase [Pseudonocardia sp. McavD-2-B]MCO7191505.1 acyl-CoA dehydrogenase [Pseudonocardia sp. McavD-2-B]
MRETDEHRALRSSVRRIADGYGHDYFVEQARSGGKADELWADLGAQGFLGVNLPEEFGGGGAGLLELSMVAEEISAAGCPLLMLIVSPTICGSVIARFGTNEQKKERLPRIASGEEKYAFSITEPDAGSNTHAISTRAVQDGSDWVLNGTKYWCSGADEATTILVVARTGERASNGSGRLTLFLVDADAPGLTTTVIPAEVTSPEKQFTLFFDDVRVPAENVVGEVGEGLGHVFHGLNPERIMCAATSNGIARYAIAKGATYARERSVFGVPIGTHQGISHPLAEAHVQVELARLMTNHAAGLYDDDLSAGEASNMAKLAAADASLVALDRAIQTHGGNGMSTEYGLSDMWAMARLLKVAPVSREMVLNYVAQHSLTLPKAY